MRIGLPITVILAGAVMGCSANVVGEGELGVRGEAVTRGKVNVERTLTHAPEGLTTRNRLSAQFMRVTGSVSPSTAERIVSGSRADVAPQALGCVWRSEESASLLLSGLDGVIELVDVGELLVRTPHELLPLAVRAFPDVGEIVSGVVYTSRDDSTVLSAGTTYSIEASGSAFVDGFTVQLEAPTAPLNVKLAGRSIGEGKLTLPSHTDVEMSWTAEDSNEDDRILLSLVPIHDEVPALACLFPDSGTATVPSQFVEFEAGTEWELSVHRKRGRTLNPEGIDTAEVAFDFAVAARVVIGD